MAQSKSVKGITLDPWNVYHMEISGALVYVEAIRSTYMAVVALPEQPEDYKHRSGPIPGKVGATKMSVYLTGTLISRDDLSPRNLAFLDEFEDLRQKHGPQFNVLGSAAPVEGPQDAPAPVPAARRKRREAPQSVPAASPAGDPPGDSPTPQEAASAAAPAKVRKAKKNRPARATAGTTFVLASEDLTLAQALPDPVGPRFQPGNRFYRAFEALKNLPDRKGTLEQITSALEADGGKELANARKVATRAIGILSSDKGGSIITKD